MTVTLADSLRWSEEGTRLFTAELGKLDVDHDTFNGPSLLPGWTLKHLVGHVAKNAEAISNLVTWATTGVETPMYSSSDQRNSDIEASTTKTPADLVSEYEISARQLAEGWAGMTEDEWAFEVRTAQGRLVPASETPWMRAREVMVHAVDLGAGLTFSDLPAGFLAALTTDISGKRSKGGNPALAILPTDHDASWRIDGEGEATEITGTLADLTAWLAGRSETGVSAAAGHLPSLPAWL